MAYFVGTAKQTATAAVASYTLTLPDNYQTDDILYAVLSQDGGGTTIAPDAAAVTAGWIIVGGSGGQAASGASRQVIALCRATSGAMTNPTFTGATDDWIGSCIPVRDVPTTWNLATLTEGVDYKRADWNNVSSAASAALTTPDDGRLLLYSWNADGASQYMRCALAEATCLDKYATANISHIAAFKQQQTAGAAPSVTMWNINATEGGNSWVLAIPNKAGGALQPDLRPSVSEPYWYGSWSSTHDGAPTLQAPSSFAASINGITCSSTAPTVVTNNQQVQTPWGASTSIASTEITAGAWVGETHAIASTDMTGKVFSLQWSATNSTLSVAGSDGILVGFSDGTNWVVYQIATKAKGWFTNFEDTAFVALGNATPYASSGSINWAAVTRRGTFVHRVGSATTQFNVSIKNEALFGPTALTGGGAARPATLQDYQSLMNSWGTWRWADIQASSQVMLKSSLQIGDGTNKTYFDGAAQSVEFPQAWSASSSNNWQMFWNALASSVGLSVKASAADTINLASGVAATETQQALTIDAASSTSAAYSFAQSFVGFAPTLKTGVNASGATFKRCGKIAAKGSNLTDCTIGKTTATDAAINFDTSGAVVTRTTIDLTGSATSYHIELGASNTSITLTDVTFSGTPGTGKVHVLATTGTTVTITISGTTSLAAADVTSAGAIVDIVAPQLYQSVTISNITTTSRVQIYDTSATPPVGSRELYNGVPGATSITWTDSLAAVASRSIRVRIADVTGTTARDFIEANIGTCGVTSGTQSVSYLANQTNDTTYNTNAVNGSLVTGITFTDAATDLVNVNLAGGNTTWPNIYAAFAYWISTAAGIDDDIAYVDAPSPADYLLTAMKVKNTSSPSVPLTITGGFARSATTGSIVDIIDTTGGFIFPLVDHVVVATVGSGPLTATQDAKLMGLPSATTTASATLAAAATTPIAANIKQVNSLAVDGAGTEADPWGPQ